MSCSKDFTIHIKHFQKFPNAFVFWRDWHLACIDIPSRKYEEYCTYSKMGGSLHLFIGEGSGSLVRNMTCDLLWFRFKMTSVSSKPRVGNIPEMWGWTWLQRLLVLGMPHPRSCPFNLYLFFMHINQVFFGFFGLWCRWEYISMIGTHLMNIEHCFKNSLVIAIMFRVALGN
jgi:hypothetical protein